MDIFDEHEMQTVEVVGDFYTFKSHAQHPINSHALTNQFKQVLRRFSELTRAPLAWPVARRVRPFKGVGVGRWGYRRYLCLRCYTHEVFEFVNLKMGLIFRDVYTLVLSGQVAGLC